MNDMARLSNAIIIRRSKKKAQIRNEWQTGFYLGFNFRGGVTQKAGVPSLTCPPYPSPPPPPPPVSPGLSPPLRSRAP